jgi:hypothetical protein
MTLEPSEPPAGMNPGQSAIRTPQFAIPDPLSAIRREPRWYPWACFLLMLAALQLVAGPKIRLSQWEVQAAHNAGVAEGVAWLEGRLDIPQRNADLLHERMHDTALFNGKVYNVFPPLMGFLTVALAPLHKLLEHPTDYWFPWFHTILIFWPLPIAAFVVLRRHAGDSAWAALLTLALMAGTPVLPNLFYAAGGELAQSNHVVSQVGLLIFAADMLGRRRIWPALIGLALSTWTRQMTLLYALPLLWVAWKEKRLVLALAGLALITSPLLTLNYLKFGNPLDFGYQYIYVGREGEELAQRCKEYGLFSPHFVASNAYYMHLAPPDIELGVNTLRIVDPNPYGTSIWITTPLLMYVFVAAGSWLRDPPRRLLMLGTLAVILGLSFYHSPGFLQHGYNRFALDFLPIWLVVVAGRTLGGPNHRWSWLTVGCITWSLLYFQSIVPDIFIRNVR